jgi:hypothetical protein
MAIDELEIREDNQQIYTLSHWERYEKLKGELRRENLSPREYQEEIKKIIVFLKI